MTADESHDDRTRTHVILANDTMVSHYRIVEKIGAGGMGEIYLAEDTSLHRKVALKFLPSHFVASDDVRTRFNREAQAVAQLNHPNIIHIYEVSDYHGRPYFVMEYIEGKSLHQFAHDQSLPTETIIDYAIQICQGYWGKLIAPESCTAILKLQISLSTIKVGFACLILVSPPTEGDDKITKTGSTLGTVSYMSPEQVTGREIDQRSDLFSLGCGTIRVDFWPDAV